MNAKEEEEFEAKRTKPPKLVLDDLSIGELQAYINDLEGEILRVEVEIDKKSNHRKSVEGLFKT